MPNPRKPPPPAKGRKRPRAVPRSTTLWVRVCDPENYKPGPWLAPCCGCDARGIVTLSEKRDLNLGGPDDNGYAMKCVLVPLVEPTEEELDQIYDSVRAVAGHILTRDAARWLWALGARPQGGKR